MSNQTMKKQDLYLLYILLEELVHLQVNTTTIIYISELKVNTSL